jgi:SAM-dependent methyltransferase
VTFSVHNSYNLPFRDGTFDAVIVSNILHIVEHPADVLADARRVLKADGLLIAPTYVGRESVRARIFSWVLKRTGHPVYTRFTSRSLRALVERSGFEVADQALLKNILARLVHRSREDARRRRRAPDAEPPESSFRSVSPVPPRNDPVPDTSTSPGRVAAPARDFRASSLPVPLFSGVSGIGEHLPTIRTISEKAYVEW